MNIAGDRHREGVHQSELNALLFLSLLPHHIGNHVLALSYAEQAWQIAQGMGSRLRWRRYWSHAVERWQAYYGLSGR
jgi:hypothetical protein